MTREELKLNIDYMINVHDDNDFVSLINDITLDIMKAVDLYTSDLRKENEELKVESKIVKLMMSEYQTDNTNLNEHIEELEKGINDTINNHRKKVMLTCEEGCWCWGLSKLTGGE